MTNGAISTQNSVDLFQLARQLEAIFMPHHAKCVDAAYANGKLRVAHYTSAEAALNIIRSKRLWMRNTTCMSDYREVQHGFSILSDYFRDDRKNKIFIAALDGCVPGAASEGLALFGQWWNDIQVSSYVVSVSEHSSAEDLYGRLSMWRAFGGDSARVAIVFDIPRYSQASTALNLIFSPVAYLRRELIYAELDEIVNNIRTYSNFLSSIDRRVVVNFVFNMLTSAVTCLKHEGFIEEKEWRGVYAPQRAPSPFVKHSTEVVRGVPQPVYKLPLDATVSPVIADLDMSRIFDRLIIGPSQYPRVMYEAFVEALGDIGIPSPETRVFASDIPIRS